VSQSEIHRIEGENWSYTVDASHLPEYVILTLAGLFTPEAFRQGISFGREWADRQFGYGKAVAPTIIDLSDMQFSQDFALQDMREATRPSMYRYTKTVLVYHYTDWNRNIIFEVFSMLLRQVKTTGSVAEAVDLLQNWE